MFGLTGRRRRKTGRYDMPGQRGQFCVISKPVLLLMDLLFDSRSGSLVQLWTADFLASVIAGIDPDHSSLSLPHPSLMSVLETASAAAAASASASASEGDYFFAHLPSHSQVGPTSSVSRACWARRASASLPGSHGHRVSLLDRSEV